MAYLGLSPTAGENNTFRILDTLSSFTATFDGSVEATPVNPEPDPTKLVAVTTPALPILILLPMLI